MKLRNRFKKLIQNNSLDIFLILVLLLCGFLFRLYRSEVFQYWSDDEQLLWYIMRHIVVDRHPSLVVPNVALGVGLGSLYHYFLAPWYFLVNMNPKQVLYFGYFFSALNIILIYFAGKIISGGSRKVAITAGLLYTFSFIAILFDKRLWALSPNISVVLISIIALVKILEGKHKFLFLLIPAYILQFNSDPSLAVITLASLGVFVVYKVRFPPEILFRFSIIIMLFLLPLLVFEVRHNLSNFRAIIYSLSEKSQVPLRLDVQERNFLVSQLENFSRIIFPKPSESADAYFCYCFLDDKINILMPAAISGGILFFWTITLKERNKKYAILLFFIGAYIAGKFLFQTVAKGYPVFFYSIVILPVVILILSLLISLLRGPIYFFILSGILLFNIHALNASSFRFPLKDKLELTNKVQNKLEDLSVKEYSLYYSGDILLASGGFTALFNSVGAPPSKGNISSDWGHAYESFKIYPRNFQTGEPEVVVVISEKIFEEKQKKDLYAIIREGEMYAVIYDNRKKWFYPGVSVEKLYQHKYFRN